MSALVIYHGDCYDGFTAAWVAAKVLDDKGEPYELYGARYGDPPPDVCGRDVYVLDFSYSREVMQEMYVHARSMVVFDHHKTAQEACEGLDFCTFDMEHSGCRMAWDYFNDSPPPFWLLCVEDRDLWRFTFQDTKNVHAYIASLPMTLNDWYALASMPLDEIVQSGMSIRRYIDTYLHKAAKESRLVEFVGHSVAVLNIPYQNASEAASFMLDAVPDAVFSMGYFQRADGRWQFSLRSHGDFDVSEIAKRFGGGGHKGAAGFDLPSLPDPLL